MGMPGIYEILIIAAVAGVLLFGPSQLPKMARSLGSVIPSFKKGLKEVDDEIRDFKRTIDDI
jgi:TatA/E family protein of Tat protein translocase